MRKAITPVVSVILMIMLVVAITGGAWYWMTNVQGSLQESAGSNIEQTSTLSTTQFSIVSATCNAQDSGGESVVATLLNTGSDDIAAGTDYIMTISSLQGSVLATDTDATPDDAGAIGSSLPVVVTGDLSASTDLENATYTVKINIGGSSQTSTVTCADDW